MRPVNLIPPEERRGESAPSRTGGLAYVVVAVLAIGLAALVGVLMLDKRVSDREAQAVAAETEQAQLEARGSSLTSFVTLQGIRDARVMTVDALARSRFDWERILREFSLVIPDGIWLTEMTGTVNPSVKTTGSGRSELRGTIPGPALVLSGCGRNNNDIARLVSAMEDIDGVTRVTAADSAKVDGGEGIALAGDDCRTRPSIPAFNLIAAFDEVPVPEGATPAAPATPAPAPVAADGGVADAQAQQEASQDEIAGAQAESQNASNLVPEGG